jgi:hypothetical protein
LNETFITFQRKIVNMSDIEGEPKHSDQNNSTEGGERVTPFTDSELFDKSHELWFRKHHPEWDDEAIARAVERAEIGGLVEKYEEMKEDPNVSSEELKIFYKEIERRRKILGNRIP